MNKKRIGLATLLCMFPLSSFASFMVSYSSSYTDDHYSNLNPNYVETSDGEAVRYVPSQYATDPDAEPVYRYYKKTTTTHRVRTTRTYASKPYNYADYAARMPSTINPTGEKVIIVDPNKHAWGAYGPDGRLIRGGIATSGGNWCPDIGRRCHTKSGSFRIQTLGSADCKSTKYPVGRGGAPMPYCMYFNGGQGLHGSYEVVDANASHGCVRMKVQDAEWMRFNFANIGTRVTVKPY